MRGKTKDDTSEGKTIITPTWVGVGGSRYKNFNDENIVMVIIIKGKKVRTNKEREGEIRNRGKVRESRALIITVADYPLLS